MTDGESPPITAPVRQPRSSSRLLRHRQLEVAAEEDLVTGAQGQGLKNGERGEDEEAKEDEEEEVEAEKEEEEEEDKHKQSSESGTHPNLSIGGGAQEEDREKSPDTPMISRLKSGAFSTMHDSLEWKGAGGEFGLSADWREAISMPDGKGEGEGEAGGGGSIASLRGKACMTEEKRAEVQAILNKRRATPSTNKVRYTVERCTGRERAGQRRRQKQRQKVVVG